MTAVDFSSVGIEKARRLAASREVEVTFIEGDVLEWIPPADAFDLVVVLYLQLERAARRRALRHAAQALAAGGVLLVVGHDSTNLTEGFGGPKDPDVLFSPDDVVSDLEGLDIVRAERVTRRVTTDDGDVDAIDALVRAVRPG